MYYFVIFCDYEPRIFFIQEILHICSTDLQKQFLATFMQAFQKLEKELCRFLFFWLSWVFICKLFRNQKKNCAGFFQLSWVLVAAPGLLSLCHVSLAAPHPMASQLPNQGLHSCSLHWKVDSLPLDPQGSPQKSF